MPAEILLHEQAQQKQSHSQSNNVNNSMRGHHINAMMAQQRTSEPSNLAEIAQTHAGTKISPYGNSQIKSWGRPIKG